MKLLTKCMLYISENLNLIWWTTLSDLGALLDLIKAQLLEVAWVINLSRALFSIKSCPDHIYRSDNWTLIWAHQSILLRYKYKECKARLNSLPPPPRWLCSCSNKLRGRPPQPKAEGSSPMVHQYPRRPTNAQLSSQSHQFLAQKQIRRLTEETKKIPTGRPSRMLCNQVSGVRHSGSILSFSSSILNFTIMLSFFIKGSYNNRIFPTH